MSTIIDMPVDQFITDNYRTYGTYALLHRAVPGLDGLKPVYRRVLMALKDVANGKLAPTDEAIGRTKLYHPFNPMAISDVITEMARTNAIISEGEFGFKLIETVSAANSRYTAVGLSEDQSKYYFQLNDYTHQIEGEEMMEPESLIIPVPYCLVHGAFNWTLGLSARTPAFTYSSLLAAYYADDPDLLEPSYGYLINRKKSTLKSLWEEGIGRVALQYNISRINQDTIILSGSGESFIPAMPVIEKHQATGQVLITNESDNNIILRISRTPYSRSIDMDEVCSDVILAGTKIRPYDVRLVFNDKVIRLGIRDWLGLSISRYRDKYNQSKSDRIAKLERGIEIAKYVPEVGKLLIQNKTDEEILGLVDGLNDDILTGIKSKTLSSLRKHDVDATVNRLSLKIDEVKSEDADEVIKSINPYSAALTN